MYYEVILKFVTSDIELAKYIKNSNFKSIVLQLHPENEKKKKKRYILTSAQYSFSFISTNHKCVQ